MKLFGMQLLPQNSEPSVDEIGDGLLDLFQHKGTTVASGLLDLPLPSQTAPNKPAFDLLGVSGKSILGTAKASPFLAPATKAPSVKRGQLICIIGKPGIGKSSWGLQWPSPEVIIEPRDQGVIDLVSEGLTPITMDNVFLSSSYGAYKSNLEASIAGSCKTIVCESLRGIQAMCLEHCSVTDHGGDYSPRSFLNYQQGPIQAAEKYFQALVDLMMTAQTKGKHVILVGHSKSIAQENKTGDDWLADTLEADKRISAIVGAAFSNIFHIVDAVSTEKRQGKIKATDSASRWMYVNVNPFYFAKNRMGLVGECEFSNTPRAAYLSYCDFAGRDSRTGFKA